MRYFTYLAEQAFKTAPTGERLFYTGGWWTRPRIIPDAATEQRLFKKQVWLTRGFFGLMVFGQPFLFLFYPGILSKPLAFIGYFGVVLGIASLTRTILFQGDLQRLKPLSQPLQFARFHAQTTKSHSVGALALGFLCSLTCVIGGLWMLKMGGNVAIAAGGTLFFTMCAVVWGYNLYRKLKER